MMVLPKSTFDYWMQRLDVLGCSTWGELRESVSTEVYDEVSGMCGYGTFAEYAAHLATTGAVPLPGVEQLAAESYDPENVAPGDDQPFSSGEIPAYADGDWPPAVELLMNEELPVEILTRFAEQADTIFNGTYAEIPASDRDAVLDELGRLGFKVQEEPALEVLANCRY
jgi:hypothetical protein